MNTDLVLAAVEAILSKNSEKIEFFSQTKGGWEIWLQCELSFAFEGGCQREVAVYPNPAQKCDLCFQNKFIVEIKALGIARVTGGGVTGGGVGQFLSDVAKDLDKLTTYEDSGAEIVVVPNFPKIAAQINPRLNPKTGFTEHNQVDGKFLVYALTKPK